MSVILYASGMPKQDSTSEPKKSCGCGAKRPEPGHVQQPEPWPNQEPTINQFDKIPTEQEILKMAIPTASTKAAMCHVCPFRAKGANGGATGCTINGKSIANIANYVNDCPMGRWATGSNSTHWMGLTWAGVPEPIRWALTLHKRRNVNLDGCGCVVGLKTSSIGPILEPWFEGISMMRQHVGNFLEEFKMVVGSMKEPSIQTSK